MKSGLTSALIITTLFFICACNDGEDNSTPPVYYATFSAAGADMTLEGGYFGFSEEDTRWGATWNQGQSEVNELFIRLPGDVSSGKTYTDTDSGPSFLVMYKDASGTRYETVSGLSFSLEVTEWGDTIQGTFHGSLEDSSGHFLTLADGNFNGRK